MPIKTELASDVWNRYQYVRDNGHLDYVKKAKQCEDFFAGLQWDPVDLAMLREVRRPALTINKIISTLSNIMGEQIFNRTEIAYRPRGRGASEEMASVMTKVFMQISDNNQLPYVRSDVFADGIIGSRGFYDVRLDFSDSLRGEVRLEQLNPKNVLIDPDADSYDPDKWNDVMISKWMSPDEIELLYSKADADLLRGRMDSFFPYGYDSMDLERDRFGLGRFGPGVEINRGGTKHIRVIERQWKKLFNMKHFVNIETGDMRQIPDDWDRDRISQYLEQNPQITITKKLIPRIRWTVIADAVVLHDDWSPYKHYTVVPFFPYFRRGRTVGIVENLLGPQELLNKVSSQELHVVNTTANSGWKLKSGALKNMSTAELEQRGAQTGIVLELDDIKNAEKISPNNTPTGLDRISFKAEEHIKTIAGSSDYQTGNPREDVSAKAIRLNQARGSANFAKVMDNLNRTDNLLARAILDCVQTFYTEERLLFITKDRVTGQVEEIAVNQVTPEGAVMNDLTVGEYSIVVTTQPERDVFEDTQLEQLVSMREDLGVKIPDKFLIQASRVVDKAAIIEAIEGANSSPEAIEQRRLALEQQRADVSKSQAEALSKQTAAQLNQAKAKKELTAAGESDSELMKLEAEMQLERDKLEMEMALERDKMEMELALKREAMQKEHELKMAQAKEEATLNRAVAMQQAAAKPKQNEGVTTQ